MSRRPFAIAALVLASAAALTACASDADVPTSIDQTVADADDRAAYALFSYIAESENTGGAIEWANTRPDMPRLLECRDDSGDARYGGIPAVRISSDKSGEEIESIIVSAYADAGTEMDVLSETSDADASWVYESTLTGTTVLGTTITVFVTETTSEINPVSLRLHSDTLCFTVDDEDTE